MINLLYAGNDRVFDGLLTSLLSIIKHCKEELNVYILTADLTKVNSTYKPFSQEQANILEKVIKKSNPLNKVIVLNEPSFNDEIMSSANVQSNYTPFAYLRLYADRYKQIPDKILYLDYDVMAYSNIKELYDINIEEFEYAGAKDYYGKFFINRNYLNSGVLLINMKKIRKTKLLEKALNMCNTKKMMLPDQSALNKCSESKLIIARRFNEQKKLYPDTVLRHFSKTIRFFPYPHTLNIKQFQIDKVHKYYKCFEFDDILEEYLKIKKSLN